MNAGSRWQRILRCMALVIALTFTSACYAVDGTWEVVQIMSKSESYTEITETVEARYCQEKEQKQVGCFTSINRSFSVSAQGAAGMQDFNLKASASLNVETEFGIEQGSTENLNLPEPLPGQIVRYTITKKYRVFKGTASIQSPNRAAMLQAPYTYQSTCSLTILSKEVINCPESSNASKEQKFDPNSTVAALLNAALLSKWKTKGGAEVEFTLDGQIIRPNATPSTYKWIDGTHIEEKTSAGNTIVTEIHVEGDNLTMKQGETSINLKRTKKETSQTKEA